MIDACPWEDFITSSLPQLTIFKFKFSCNSGAGISDKFKQLPSDFWHQRHHRYTEYSFDEELAHISTIPSISNAHVLTPHQTRHQNQWINNVNTFDNVSDVILWQEVILRISLYYFSNVTSLTLKSESHVKDVNKEPLIIEHIDSLKTIVNLSHLKHLTISSTCRLESSSFLQLLKETSQLSSITIELRRLQLFFNHDELCKYLNKKLQN